MIILGIETSCDETAIAILKYPNNPRFSTRGWSAFGGKILSNIISSQVKIHAKWGGVVPNLAKREHLKNLPIVLKKALKEAKIEKKKIDIIAVTTGPGLEPALWTGINFATDLSKAWGKPIIAINHMEGHIFSTFLSKKEFSISNLQFPILALLVSGGHTELVLIKNWLKYKIIGQTRDDAAGEAFDKVAKMLGLPYPGGPQVAKLTNKRTPSVEERSGKTLGVEIKLPRPMINSKNYDFSFSGLKTAVLYKIKELGIMNKELKMEICKEFQQAVIDVLISKTIRAAKEYKAKTIILGGGVAANKELRVQLEEKIKREIPNTKYLMPNIEYAGDNAVMIAIAAYFHACLTNKRALKKEYTNWKKLKANGNLSL